MSLNKEQIQAFAQQFSALAAIFNPGAAASIQLLVAAATQLNEMIGTIKKNDPEMWNKVADDFNAAVAAFDASVPKSQP